MLASVATFALEGVDSREVTVEVDLRRGLPAFSVVGLPDAAVREARERVRAALLNSGLEFPLQRLTANLAPADVRKAGPSFDLALAVALLAASGQIPREALRGYAVCGELSLERRAAAGPRDARDRRSARAGAGYERLVVPAENAAEAALVEGLEVDRRRGPARARRALLRGRSASRAPCARRRARRRARVRPTSPTCAARPTPSARSRSPRPAATTC